VREPRVHRGRTRAGGATREADPVTTEVLRHGLNSAAEQMKRALVRTSFSPVIYEILDFAAALYDRHARLLAQAPSNPLFMGTLNFAVEGAIEAVGGIEAFRPGDIVLINVPYVTGSHQQDAAVVMPAFLGDEPLGFAVIKAHWQDMGAKDPYCTDTVDVFQEGLIFPGVKLYDAGERVDAVYRIALANTRMPEMVAGDINAEIVGVRTGADALERIAGGLGADTFWACVERMYDHGEAVMRARLAEFPTGRYRARGKMDDDGIDAAPVEFEVVVEVDGSGVTIDFTNAPPSTRGPINSPLPSTVSASRVAVAMLAGPGEPPNEGHFRALDVVTVPGTIFDPESPAPCYLGGWLAMQTIDVIHRAFAQALPAAVPAGSGGCINGAIWWGDRPGGEPWSDSTGHPIGQGAHAGGDGAHSLMHLGEAASRFACAEVFEARYPVRWDYVELAQDSCGAGTFAGGLGIDAAVTAMEDAWVTCVVERTTLPPWGLQHGEDARPNAATIQYPDGTSRRCDKATALRVPAGATLRLATGGGGGFGPAAERDPAAVRADVRNEIISEAYARQYYAHAFAAEDGAAT
jgi:N-methylhydantoinase B